MKPSLERLGGAVNSGQLCDLLKRDGAAVVEDALTAEQLAGLNADLERIVSATAPGLRHPSHDRLPLLGHVDHAHAPLADLLQELVGTDLRAGRFEERLVAGGVA